MRDFEDERKTRGSHITENFLKRGSLIQCMSVCVCVDVCGCVWMCVCVFGAHAVSVFVKDSTFTPQYQPLRSFSPYSPFSHVLCTMFTVFHLCMLSQAFTQSGGLHARNQFAIHLDLKATALNKTGVRRGGSISSFHLFRSFFPTTYQSFMTCCMLWSYSSSNCQLQLSVLWLGVPNVELIERSTHLNT